MQGQSSPPRLHRRQAIATLNSYACVGSVLTSGLPHADGGPAPDATVNAHGTGPFRIFTRNHGFKTRVDRDPASIDRERVQPCQWGGAAYLQHLYFASVVDGLIHGGLNVGTATLAAGTPGLGKTLLGLHFLAEGARLGQPGLFVRFTENNSQLRAKARMFGIDLQGSEAAGTIKLLTWPRSSVPNSHSLAIHCSCLPRTCCCCGTRSTRASSIVYLRC